jgi:hypothetical protein
MVFDMPPCFMFKNWLSAFKGVHKRRCGITIAYLAGTCLVGNKVFHLYYRLRIGGVKKRLWPKRYLVPLAGCSCLFHQGFGGLLAHH